MADVIQLRRDTAANWASVNPILHQGEVGGETDTGAIKIGDGVTAWNSLLYSFVRMSGNDTIAGVKTFSGIPYLSGGGIRFPATQVASSDPNTLDDYEEGSILSTSLNITIGGSSTGITYASRAGVYCKTGMEVKTCIVIALSNKGALSGAVQVSGLPFTTGSALTVYPFSLYVNNTTYTGQLQARPGSGVTTVSLAYLNESGTLTELQGSNLTNTSVIAISGSYPV